jgi:hypothetical protein
MIVTILSALAQLHRAQDDALFLVEGDVGMVAPAWSAPVKACCEVLEMASVQARRDRSRKPSVKGRT